ncbi:MAG: orotidine-5'-phosphate decarboxylase [Phycisphaerales bacterium]|nr:orotidine-5'-phosphate decarboxylase [Phycisphaerales bacterium]
MTAADKLAAAAPGFAGLSVGLEPAAEYLPPDHPEFPDTPDGHERFLRAIVEAAAPSAAAFKFNLAFFEALDSRAAGPVGTALLYRLREFVAQRAPRALVIADAKRSDIGTSAARYAKALYRGLEADAATVNPLMGRDACEPFLEHTDRLTYFLVLTSNPGAADFLAGDLSRRIAARLVEWAAARRADRSLGFVVGATRAEQVEEVRARAPAAAWLVPGVGAQGGDLQTVVRRGRPAAGTGLPMLIHVTRGLLPKPGEPGDMRDIMRRRAEQWHADILAAQAEPARA